MVRAVYAADPESTTFGLRGDLRPAPPSLDAERIGQRFLGAARVPLPRRDAGCLRQSLLLKRLTVAAHQVEAFPDMPPNGPAPTGSARSVDREGEPESEIPDSDTARAEPDGMAAGRAEVLGLHELLVLFDREVRKASLLAGLGCRGGRRV